MWKGIEMVGVGELGEESNKVGSEAGWRGVGGEDWGGCGLKGGLGKLEKRDVGMEKGVDNESGMGENTAM